MSLRFKDVVPNHVHGQGKTFEKPGKERCKRRPIYAPEYRILKMEIGGYAKDLRALPGRRAKLTKIRRIQPDRSACFKSVPLPHDAKTCIGSTRIPGPTSHPMAHAMLKTDSVNKMLKRMRMPLFALTWLLAAGLVSESGAAPGPGSSVAVTNDLFARSAQGFFQMPEVRREIDPQHVSSDLLSAAIFHVSNLRRAAEGLPVLGADPRVRKAAELQAAAMAETKTLDHIDRKHADRRTPKDRVDFVGLNPRYVAENIARGFARRYESGKSFYIDQVNGKDVFSYTPGGPPIGMHTYQSFAESVVNGWMKSSEHRKNLLSKDARFLGCGAVLSRDQAGMEVLYCVQVFFTPRSTQ